jgi:hypothetical protein
MRFNAFVLALSLLLSSNVQSVGKPEMTGRAKSSAMSRCRVESAAAPAAFTENTIQERPTEPTEDQSKLILFIVTPQSRAETQKIAQRPIAHAGVRTSLSDHPQPAITLLPLPR